MSPAQHQSQGQPQLKGRGDRLPFGGRNGKELVVIFNPPYLSFRNPYPTSSLMLRHTPNSVCQVTQVSTLGGISVFDKCRLFCKARSKALPFPPLTSSELPTATSALLLFLLQAFLFHS